MDFFDSIGQRAFATFLSGVILIVLYVVAVLTGRNPLELPIGPDGQLVTPEVILNLLAPVIMLVLTIGYLFKSITTRVAIAGIPGAQAQAIDPGDIGQLFQIREFWVQIVTTVFAGLMLFNLRFWDEGQQATMIDVIVSLIMALLTRMQASYASRPAGATVQVVDAT
jgi:hypothetical protein